MLQYFSFLILQNLGISQTFGCLNFFPANYICSIWNNHVKDKNKKNNGKKLFMALVFSNR